MPSYIHTSISNSHQYWSEYLTRHWSKNTQGYCLADTCTETIGTLEHLLVHCPALAAVRQRMWNMFFERSVMFPALYSFLLELERSLPQTQIQFLLDPRAFPEVQEIWEMCGQPAVNHVYYLTRTYVYYLYRQKQILLGLWTTDNFRTKFHKKSDKHNNHNKICLINPTLITGSSTPDGSSSAQHPTNLPGPDAALQTQWNMGVAPLLSAQHIEPYTALCFDRNLPGQSCTCCGGVRCQMCTNSSTLLVSNNALVHSVPCNTGSEYSDHHLTDPPDLLPLPDHDQGHLCVCDAGTDGQLLGSHQSYH